MYQVTDGMLPVADVPYALMTHIAVGAAIPQNDGSVDFDPYGATIAVIDDIVRRAHAAGSKAILMVGGAGDSVHTGFVNSSTAARRPTFVNNLVTWAKAHAFDGLDLDWEPLDAADRPNFLALAQDIRAAWPAAVLTVPIGYVNINIDHPDAWFGGLAAVFDQINIMSYGMAGAYSGWMSWHSSALQGEKGNTPTSIDSTVKAYTAAAVAVPAAKLGVGSGFYGICYGSPVTAPNQTPGTGFSADDNANAYNVIITLGGTRSWDSTAFVPYLTFSTPAGANKCTYISYEDPQSLTEKASYVKTKGLGGVIVWTIAEGHLKTGAQKDPLLDALSTGLR